MSSHHFLGGLHRSSNWIEQQLAAGRFGHLPGVLTFAAIAATIFFVQEVEKRRRRKP